MRKVYPRVCGGAGGPPGGGQVRKGLSPRVRGSRRDQAASTPTRRSIPACAGEPLVVAGAGAEEEVYPRVCGGALGGQVRAFGGKGLSPRVRGSPWWPGACVRRQGSIPACAGEPVSQDSSRRNARVYPRVCGGAPGALPLCLRCRGLSPRVRGSRQVDQRRRLGRGSIPACAGEPARPWAFVRPGPVYPRVCGGAQDITIDSATMMGLSPRVRGSLIEVNNHIGLEGSIPACAGEPSRGL